VAQFLLTTFGQRGSSIHALDW